MDMAELTLEQRVQRIEDAEEIRRLRYLYCEYGNLYDAERFAALFAPDAIWDGGDAFGRQEGLEQIEQMVRDAGRANPLLSPLHHERADRGQRRQRNRALVAVHAVRPGWRVDLALRHV